MFASDEQIKILREFLLHKKNLFINEMNPALTEKDKWARIDAVLSFIEICCGKESD